MKASSTFGRIALVFAATLAAYAPAFHAALIWNDEDYVTRADLQPWHGLARIWFEVGATQQYYPVLHTAFWIEHRLWGDAAWGYHLCNILLHAAAACLFAFVLRHAFGAGSRLWPWFAALLFALHPICVESVAWVSEEKNTLSLVFYLLSALACLRWFDRPERRSLYALALFLYVLSILSKSVAATLPGALLVVQWCRRGRLSWRSDVVPLIPWFVLGAADGLFTGWVEKTFIGAYGSAFALSLPERVLLVGRVVCFYAGKIAWPLHLVFIYPHWTVSLRSPVQYVYPVVVILAAAFLLRLVPRSRAPLAAFLFFLGSLLPTSGLFNVFAFLFSYVADHWTYLPSLGPIALAAGAWGFALERQPSLRPALYAAAAAVLVACGLLASRECRVYRDPEVFYRTIIDRNPAAWMAENNLGILLVERGEPEEAIQHYQAMLRLNPDYPEGHSNFGNALFQLNRVAEAEAQYRRAIELNPAYVDARLNLANLLRDTDRIDEAMPHYQEALRLAPRSAEAHHNLAIAYAKLGRSAEALAEFHKALDLNPGYAHAHYDLGIELHLLGRTDEAISEYATAVRLDPNFFDAETNLAVELVRARRLADSVAAFQAAIRLRPNDAPTRYRLAIVLQALGRTEEAQAAYREALKYGPPPER